MHVMLCFLISACMIQSSLEIITGICVFSSMVIDKLHYAMAWS
jgi:hypothetical protein